MKPPNRIALSKDNAVDIYKLKQAFTCTKNHGKSTADVAREYGVSSKAIRDIWVGRTWYRETFHLDPSRSDAAERLMKRVGRPKGAKDSKPRLIKGRQGSKHLLAETESAKSHTLKHPNHNPASHMPEKGCPNRTKMKSGTASLNLMGAQNLIGINDLLHEWHQLLKLSDPFHDDWPFWDDVHRVPTLRGATSEISK